MTSIITAPEATAYFAYMMLARSLTDLIRKYDVPTPRYTSYPTVPHWNIDSFSKSKWEEAVVRAFNETNESHGISLYVHLPFCESLCTYCACNKRITKNHGVEKGYIESLLTEWRQYNALFGRTPTIRELHLGGGTPTFFSPENLHKLVSEILAQGIVHPEHEFSFEGHPNNTTTAHLQTLYDLGCRRVSFGVQDLDPLVQKTINRIQPLENLEKVTRESRRIGYTSISYDLIYGLPHQTRATVSSTMEKVLPLRPDRISFYSYAHVPWVSPGQRGYSESDLPTDIEKRVLYETGRAILKEAGYEDIGMDHFALRTDALYQAMTEGTLNRNFMGYTTSTAELLIGLGSSAISDAKYAYAQNLKKVEEYRQAIDNNGSAVFKGHLQSHDDRRTRAIILDIACRGKVNVPSEIITESMRARLLEMVEEGILLPSTEGYTVTETGRAFVRNICGVFDPGLQQPSTQVAPVFSKAI